MSTPSKSVTLSSVETSIMAAIAAGANRTGAISKATGLGPDLLDAPLKKLKRAGLAAFTKGSGPGTGWTVVSGPPTTDESAPQDAATVAAHLMGGEDQPPASAEDAKINDAAQALVDKGDLDGAADVLITGATKPKRARKPKAAKPAAEESASPTAEERLAARDVMVERFDAEHPAPEPAEESAAEGPPATEEPAKPAPKGKKGKPAAAKPVAPVVKDDKPDEDDKPADFMLFVGGSFYDKQAFIDESAQLGISRRMPSHRLPTALVCGVSRVFVAAGGARKAGEGDQAESTSEVFGYFVPQRVEFIRSTGEDGPATGDEDGEGDEGDNSYASIVADLEARSDARIIDTIKGEAERGCGKRKQGGTYIVVDKADTPLVLLDKPATYVGNHFRGMMQLDDGESSAFMSGGTVRTLIEERCMVPTCDVPGGRAFKCAPDGHIRAERERKRMAQGQPAKWFLPCGECRRKRMASLAKARAAAKRGEPLASDTSPPADTQDGSEGSNGVDSPEVLAAGEAVDAHLDVTTAPTEDIVANARAIRQAQRQARIAQGELKLVPPPAE